VNNLSLLCRLQYYNKTIAKSTRYAYSLLSSFLDFILIVSCHWCKWINGELLDLWKKPTSPYPTISSHLNWNIVVLIIMRASAISNFIYIKSFVYTIYCFWYRFVSEYKWHWHFNFPFGFAWIQLIFPFQKVKNRLRNGWNGLTDKPTIQQEAKRKFYSNMRYFETFSIYRYTKT